MRKLRNALLLRKRHHHHHFVAICIRFFLKLGPVWSTSLDRYPSEFCNKAEGASNSWKKKKENPWVNMKVKSLKKSYCYLSVIHDEDSVRIHDSMQPMGNSQHCAILELGTNGFLDHGISPVTKVQNMYQFYYIESQRLLIKTWVWSHQWIIMNKKKYPQKCLKIIWQILLRIQSSSLSFVNETFLSEL